MLTKKKKKKKKTAREIPIKYISAERAGHPDKLYERMKNMETNYGIITKIGMLNREYQTALFLDVLGPDTLTIHN